jgi:chromate transport protein ChrA
MPRHRLVDSFKRTCLLGFTSFGGPAVHFEIFRRKFVDCPSPWIDDETVSALGEIGRAILLDFLCFR